MKTSKINIIFVSGLLLLIFIGISAFIFLNQRGNTKSGIQHQAPSTSESQEKTPIKSSQTEKGKTLIITAKNTLSQEDIAKLKSIKGVAKLETYQYGKLSDGTTVVGVKPMGAPLRIESSEELKGNIVAGRALREADEGKDLAVVGNAYAKSHKTAFGYQISEMVYPGHVPRVEIEGSNVTVVGIFETGNENYDNYVFVPLSASEQILQNKESTSTVFITLSDDQTKEKIAAEVKTILSNTAQVRFE